MKAILFLALALHAAPRPGDLFREYSWVPAGNYHVLNLRQLPLELTQAIDLDEAIAAEIALEIGNAHLGYEAMALQVNEGAWHPIPFPELTPRDPSPSLYFNQWFPHVPIPLSELRAGAGNRLLFRIGPEVFAGGNPHPAHTPVYGFTLRVYYHALRKPHTAGVVRSPRANTTVGTLVPLDVSTNGPVAQVDYVGLYEDVNYEGDGVYRQWHQSLSRGEISHHIGSARQSFVWDTSWLPDQSEPLSLAARLTGPDGLIYLTPAVTHVRLQRPFQVELLKPYGVPRNFTACQYGIYVDPGPKFEGLDLHGDPARIVDAQLIVPCWNCPSTRGFTLNGRVLDLPPFPGKPGSFHFAIVPLRPLTALRRGDNRLGTIPGPGRMSDIALPGVAILVRYAAH